MRVCESTRTVSFGENAQARARVCLHGKRDSGPGAFGGCGFSVGVFAVSTESHPRILFVDDEPGVRQSVRVVLQELFDVTTVPNAEAGLEVIGSQSPFAAIVSDMRMPGMNGATFLGRTRYMSPNSVRILVTGHADLEAAMAAVNEAYVFRFITKPWPPEQLREAIQEAVDHHDLVNADRDGLQDLVFRDDLTKLYNRRCFDVMLAQEHVRCLRYERSYALVFIDLDGLKAVNTEYGHLVGSRVIEEAGKRISSVTRASDFAFRFGGDEFVTLLVEAGKSDARTYATQVCERLRHGEIDIGGGNWLQIGASAGVAVHPDDGESAREILKNADSAMYRAKKLGMGSVACFDREKDGR